jgi:two-component system, sensor histidine kinase and response regulator
VTELYVLIVDDELGMRHGAERTLSDYRFTLSDFKEEICFRTKTADTGNAALQMIDDLTPDILILDYKLPDIHGLDILSRVIAEKKNPLTIMITAYASLEVAINATKNGAFDFLAKPFTPEELRNTVRKASEHIYLERKAQKLEEEKKQVRFQFISVVAHELKAPLAAVENYLQIMKSHISGDDIAAYDRMIARSMVRLDGMRKLIADLLDLTHIESGQRTRTFAMVDLRSLAQSVIESVEHDAAEKRITLTLDCTHTIELEADRGEIEIVVTNLVTNAVKYNRENGSVRLAIEKESGWIAIACEDTGIGIAESDMPKLFGEFSRIKNEQTKSIPGSGLGLSIVKKIVDLYGGSIRVTSKPGAGTTFVVQLPAAIKE